LLHGWHSQEAQLQRGGWVGGGCDGDPAVKHPEKHLLRNMRFAGFTDASPKVNGQRAAQKWDIFIKVAPMSKRC